MFYTQTATSQRPALVIYLIDAIHFMNMPCGATTKIMMVNKALRGAIQEMVRRSMYDGIVHPHYKIAIFAYNTKVVDMLGEICDLPDLIKHGVPAITANGKTDTIAGFMAVETLLKEHLREFQDSPAPLVCHLTDGLITGSNPTSVVKRIKAMAVNDGPVLVENVYVADNMLRSPVEDWSQWSGVVKPKQLTNGYAKFLFHLSSPLPESYRQNINNHGYDLRKEAAFFLPGTQTELVRLAFPISTVTQLK
jgi:uncharacterized protein YegL